MKRIKRVRAPVRIDFGGGSTDIPPITEIGGAVLNVAANKYITGELIAKKDKVSLQYGGNFPTSSGLGTSGAMNLVWLSLVLQTRDKRELVSKVRDLEKAMGIIGGQQDQYTSAYGGINFLRFKDGKVEMERLDLDKKFVKKFENRLVLVYTGKPHLSTNSNQKTVENYKKGTNKKYLLKIRDIAIDMKKALENKDLDKFADLMNRETKNREKLHKKIITRKVKRYINKGLKQGGKAVKICGAGSGGSLLFYCENKKNKKELEKTFKKEIIDFKFDFKGMKWNHDF